MRRLIFMLLALALACQPAEEIKEESPDLFVVTLGIAQDAGAPQIGCTKECCRNLWGKTQERQKVISLGLVDRSLGKVWLLEATPDFKDQYMQLLSYLPNGDINSLEGIFLTHAHMGHYTGLMDLGREAIGAAGVPVYAMPLMHDYLTNNGPWSQLVSLKNIELRKLQANSTINLSKNLAITPFLVPHRDEYSETVGYKVATANKSFLFIPDIDKWHKWERNIVDEVKKSSFAFLDGAFYSADELPNRNMAEIPHPFVPETMALFKNTSAELRKRIVFIHLNHTNPLLRDGPAYETVLNSGYQVGREGQIFELN